MLWFFRVIYYMIQFVYVNRNNPTAEMRRYKEPYIGMVTTVWNQTCVYPFLIYLYHLDRKGDVSELLEWNVIVTFISMEIFGVIPNIIQFVMTRHPKLKPHWDGYWDTFAAMPPKEKKTE